MTHKSFCFGLKTRGPFIEVLCSATSSAIYFVALMYFKWNQGTVLQGNNGQITRGFTYILLVQ